MPRSKKHDDDKPSEPEVDWSAGDPDDDVDKDYQPLPSSKRSDSPYRTNDAIEKHDEPVPQSMTVVMAQALAANHDQTVSHEIQLGEGVGMMIGRRAMYYRYHDKVLIVDGRHFDAES